MGSGCGDVRSLVPQDAGVRCGNRGARDFFEGGQDTEHVAGISDAQDRELREGSRGKTLRPNNPEARSDPCGKVVTARNADIITAC